MTSTSTRTNDPRWGNRYITGTSSTAGTSDTYTPLVSVDPRELEQLRREAMAGMHVAYEMQERMKTLERKFDKAIEILLARGINITEMI